jgi:hypothetical protein
MSADIAKQNANPSVVSLLWTNSVQNAERIETAEQDLDIALDGHLSADP